MPKYSWELEELDPREKNGPIPYIVKRLREDEGELVFRKVYASDWREGIKVIRGSLDLLEKALAAQEAIKAEPSPPETPKK